MGILRILVTTLFLLHLATGAIHGQDYSVQLLSHTTISMITGDLDGDGDVDIISGGQYNLVWNENLGDGTFNSRTISLDAQEVQDIVMVDLDQDGHMDLVVADLTANRILYYHNNGDRTFDRLFLHSGSAGTAGIVVADLDGDEDLDVACAAFTGNKVYWLRNDGGFSFTSINIATGLTGATRIVGDDFDDDGDVDLMVAMQTAGSIQLFKNNGANFTSVQSFSISTPRRIIMDDMDQDGDMDVLYAGTGGSGFLVNDQGVFTRVIRSTSSAYRGIGTADMNAHGHKDLLLANYDEDNVGFVAADGLGGFTGYTGLDTDLDYASLIMAADLNNDGHLDAVCGSSFDIRAYINNADGTFTTRPLNRYLGDARGICHGDFDNDGDVDIMAIGGFYMDWYENDGTGHFEAKIVRQGPSRIQVNGGIYLATADMDGDGDDDAVFSERSDDNLGWIENLGGGDFAERPLHFLNDAYGCDPVDFDGDGDMDVVASDLNGGFVYWFENDGDEVFTQHTVNTTYRTPYEVRPVDYDNDGDMDVLAACYSSLDVIGKVVLFRNTGGGNFQSVVIDASAPNTTSVFWVDLDSDGDLDILSTMADSDRVNWYESTGGANPSFTERVLASGVGFATYAVAADLDGDGDIDVAATALEDRSADWFENNGNEVFTRHELAHNVSNPQFIGIGDIDADGTPEIFASCAGTEAVHLYRRIPVEPVVGPVPTSCHDLFISELVHEPGDVALALEIFNPRSVPVDLSGYALRFYPNGDATHYASSLLTGTIAPGGTHVVVAPNFATDIDAYADQLTNIWFDGSDAIVLVHGNTPIDIIGKVGESFDDGDYWFSNGVGTFYTVLVRKPTVDHGDADGTDAFLPDVEWIAYDADDYSHLGSHDAPCVGVCTPEIAIAATELVICAGDDVQFTSNTASAGTAPSYTWTVNGAVVGGNSGAFNATDLQSNSVVICTLQSNAPCATATTVESNSIAITVRTVQVPVASISGNVLSASPVPNATYQWYLGGGLVPNGDAGSIVVTLPGIYTVVASVDGCGSSPSNAVEYEISTGFRIAELPTFELVPNPTDGPLTIRISATVLAVEVWNSTGQMVLQQQGSNVDLSAMAAGLYHVVVNTAGSRSVSRVVVH